MIGRVVPPPGEDGAFTIVDKTVSRQHLRVEVGDVGSSDSTKTEARSKITLEDLNTKIGTLVNGEQIRGRKYDLTGEENVVTVGRYKSRFTYAIFPHQMSALLTKLVLHGSR